MAYFVNSASQFERAVRALIIFQGKGTIANSYISNESVTRTLPNRTFVGSAFSPTRPYRPEGVVQLEIQHHFAAVLQPNQTNPAQRVAMDAFVGDTMDTLNLGGYNPTALTVLADAITSAGRYLAVGDGSAMGNTIAAENADMANFRCDWVKFGTPMITRGRDAADSTNWVEIIHIQGFVSHTNL